MCSADATLDEQANHMFQRRYRLHTARINTILMDGWSVLVDPFSASYVAKLKAMSATCATKQENEPNGFDVKEASAVGLQCYPDSTKQLAVLAGESQGSKEKEPVL
eukprot:3562508-Rhodomonas_salina.2